MMPQDESANVRVIKVGSYWGFWGFAIWEREREIGNVVPMGEERDMEMGSEEDEGLEAFLLCLRHHMRRRSGSHRLLRYAGH